MKPRFLLIIIFSLNVALFSYSFGQTIEKTIDFQYVSKKNSEPKKPDFGMSREQMRPFLLNLEKLNDSIKVNSFLPINGILLENGKKNYTSSGVCNLITSNYFDTQLSSIGQDEIATINFKEDRTRKYEWHEEISSKEINKYSVKSSDQFYKSNMSFLEGQTTFPFKITQEGSGMLKTKNANLVLNKINYSLSSTGFGKFEKVENLEFLNINEWKSKTKDFILNDNLKLRTQLADEKFIILVNRINSDDNYYLYRNFAIIIFDKTGKILKVHNIDFEFLRELNSAVKVFDDLGNQKGLLITFKNDSEMVGQKKKKDPFKNKFNLFYINSSGEIEMKVDLIHGENPEKDDYFQPSFAIQKNDQLHILNSYVEYTIKKNTDYFEKLVVNKSGKLSAENLVSKTKVSKGLFPSNLSFNNPIYFKGDFYSASTQFTQTFEGVKTYTNSIISKVNTDLTNPEVILAFNKGPQKDPILSSMIKTNEQIYSVVCYADGNQVLKLNGTEKPLEIVYSTNFQPLSANLQKNYVYDQKDQKLYFLLENNSAGNARLIKVGL
jgi:hypothetical protein